MTFLLAVTAQAKGLILKPGTSIDGDAVDETGATTELKLVLDVPMFLIERADIDHYNLLEKDLGICQGGLKACEDKKCTCPEPPGCMPTLLDSFGWTGVIITGLVLFIGGVVVGAKFVR